MKTCNDCGKEGSLKVCEDCKYRHNVINNLVESYNPFAESAANGFLTLLKESEKGGY